LDYRGVVVQNSIPLLNEIHAMHVLEKKGLTNIGWSVAQFWLVLLFLILVTSST
jgi:hypothetical protein